MLVDEEEQEFGSVLVDGMRRASLVAMAGCAQQPVTAAITFRRSGGEARIWSIAIRAYAGGPSGDRRQWRIMSAGRVRWRVLSRCSSRTLPRDRQTAASTANQTANFDLPRVRSLCKSSRCELGDGRDKSSGKSRPFTPGGSRTKSRKPMSPISLLRRQLILRSFQVQDLAVVVVREDLACRPS